MNEIFEEYVRLAIREDLEPLGDITTDAIIDKNLKSKLVVRARRQSGLMSGLSFSSLVYKLIDPEVKVEELIKPGQTFAPMESLAVVSGPANSILKGERIFLNLLQRAISIATYTNQFVQLVHGTKSKILDTRKNVPGLRTFERVAVRDGGAVNHRFNLSTGLLIKDNHISLAGGIRNAVISARKKLPHLTKLEVEVDSIEQIKEISDLNVDVILLDNFTLPMLEEAMQIIKKRALTEASGGITLNSVRQIAEIGLDFISIGSLTQSPPIIDIGLDFI
ncbi:MAG: carboxylating nicotinate-nucleotide diphosphorylase [Candidatus Caenarcaniphilales bacterium]|nr:carboxylating nicotinate-nucleotide diphosphorylase [Candidatus Caenarcaniphilales bacterium]